jgi:hypothetical protein
VPLHVDRKITKKKHKRSAIFLLTGALFFLNGEYCAWVESSWAPMLKFCTRVQKLAHGRKTLAYGCNISPSG